MDALSLRAIRADSALRASHGPAPEDNSMIRSSLKTLLLMFVAVVFALGSMAEAAPKKSVKTRVKHSSRISTGHFLDEMQPEEHRSYALRLNSAHGVYYSHE